MWIMVLSTFVGCTRDPESFPIEQYGEIVSIRIDPDTTSFFRSYRSAPEMGGVKKLYYGNQEGYSDIYALVELSSVEPTFFLDTLYNSDSSQYSLMDVDNVALIFSLHAAEVTLYPPNVYYFSSDGDTNLFSQTESSYFTVNPNLVLTASGNVTDEIDTLDNASFKFDITDIFEEYILDTLRLNSNTFKIIGNESIDHLIPFGSPIMEVHYFRTNVNSDSTWMDTITTTFTTKKKLTIVNPTLWEEGVDRFTVGRAKGIKSLLRFNLDTLHTLSDSILIKDADLYLQVDNDEELTQGYSLLIYPLKDSVDINNFTVEERDTTQLELAGSQSTTLDTTDHFVRVNLRNYLSYIQFGHLERFDLQLTSSPDNDPFIIHSFINDESFHPYLKVRYVVTK